MAGEGEITLAVTQTVTEAVTESVTPVVTQATEPVILFGSLNMDLFLIFCLGIVGGFVLILLLERGIVWPYDEQDTNNHPKFNFGFLADLIIGGFAALVVYAVNPPANVTQFIAAGITAGIGGKAILTGYIETKNNARLKGLFGSMANQYRSAIARNEPSRNPDLLKELDEIDKKYVDMP